MKLMNAIRAGSLAAALLLTLGQAASACVVSGPTQVCSGNPVQLCASVGGAYEWTGPGGFTATTRCVTVALPGFYSVRVFDSQSALWFTCSTTLGTGDGPPVPTITGPTTGCDGESVQLCGPDGSWTYAWTGPNGFTANTACADVSESGTYTLTITDPVTRCPAAASTTVTFAPCGGPLPQGDCPRSPAWWALQCKPSTRAPRIANLSIVDIAACVDERSTSLSFPKGADDFCAQLGSGQWRDLRWCAMRQLAGVFANVCASERHLATPEGAPIGVSSDAEIKGFEGRTTVGAWLAQADAELSSIQGRAVRTRAGIRSLERIVREGWNINHGVRMKTFCKGIPQQERFANEPPLERQIGEPEASGTALAPASPNPFTGLTRFSLAIDEPSGADVDVAVYDLAGRRLATLLTGRQGAGVHEMSWNGRTERGTAATPGVYFVRGRSGTQTLSQSVILAR